LVKNFNPSDQISGNIPAQDNRSDGLTDWLQEYYTKNYARL